MSSRIDTAALRTDPSKLSYENAKTHAAPPSLVVELGPDLLMCCRWCTHPYWDDIAKICEHMDNKNGILPIWEHFGTIDNATVSNYHCHECKQSPLP